MIILGIDPGLATVGWGVIDYRGNRFKTLGFGAIITPANLPTAERLTMIYDRISEIIIKYCPDAVAIEDCSGTPTRPPESASARHGELFCSAPRKTAPELSSTPRCR